MYENDEKKFFSCDKNRLSQTIKVKHYSRPEINDMLFSSRKSAGSNNMTGDGEIAGINRKSR